MEPCLNSEFTFEENGAGWEENVPSGNLESDVVVGIVRRNKGKDKEAGREENVPTGGALNQELNQESSLPVNPSGRQAVPSGRPSVSKESSPTPSGRQVVSSGRQANREEFLQPPCNPPRR